MAAFEYEGACLAVVAAVVSGDRVRVIRGARTGWQGTVRDGAGTVMGDLAVWVELDSASGLTSRSWIVKCVGQDPPSARDLLK